MKKLIVLAVFLSMVASSVWGQNQPIAVDNGKYFPPVRCQQVINDCTHFSLVYYLKSYLWNKHFNRDPQLEKNQFSHNFTWDLTEDATQHYSIEDAAALLMENQGCATIADYQFDEQNDERFPSHVVREAGLPYPDPGYPFFGYRSDQ